MPWAKLKPFAGNKLLFRSNHSNSERIFKIKIHKKTSHNSYVYPPIDGISCILEKDVVKKLSQPNLNRREELVFTRKKIEFEIQ